MGAIFQSIVLKWMAAFNSARHAAKASPTPPKPKLKDRVKGYIKRYKFNNHSFYKKKDNNQSSDASLPKPRKIDRQCQLNFRLVQSFSTLWDALRKSKSYLETNSADDDFAGAENFDVESLVDTPTEITNLPINEEVAQLLKYSITFNPSTYSISQSLSGLSNLGNTV